MSLNGTDLQDVSLKEWRNSVSQHRLKSLYPPQSLVALRTLGRMEPVLHWSGKGNMDSMAPFGFKYFVA
jgi:hypothetical protein